MDFSAQEFSDCNDQRNEVGHWHGPFWQVPPTAPNRSRPYKQFCATKNPLKNAIFKAPNAPSAALPHLPPLYLKAEAKSRKRYKTSRQPATMKPHIAVLYALVSLCLIFSLSALLIVANDHGAFTPNNPSATPTAKPTTPPQTSTPTSPTTHPPTTPPTPKPPATTPPNQLTITYIETNRQDLDNNKVKVTLTVTTTYPSENTLTIKYSDFNLDLAVFRMIYEYARWEAYPKNSGTFTIGSGHTTESFQLTFEFEKTLFNGMDNAHVAYKLQYNGTTPVNWDERHWQ